MPPSRGENRLLFSFLFFLFFLSPVAGDDDETNNVEMDLKGQVLIRSAEKRDMEITKAIDKRDIYFADPVVTIARLSDRYSYVSIVNSSYILSAIQRKPRKHNLYY
jgi:hypothetical protein